MNGNTVDKKYVSAITLQSSLGSIDFREIYRDVINVTNEEYSFLDMLDLQGNKAPTENYEFSSGSNIDIKQFETIASAITTVAAGPPAVISFDIANNSTLARVRQGDTIHFASGFQGYVTAKSGTSTVNLTVKAVGSATTVANLAAANAQKIAITGNANGEGSGSRENLRLGMNTKINQVQKWKDNFEISDIEKANRVEFNWGNGEAGYFHKTEMETLMRFRAEISYSLLLNELSASNWKSASPTLTDTDGNSVQTTKGLRAYIKGGGTNTTGATINAAYYATLARAFAAARTPSEFQIYQGVEGCIAHDNYASTIAANLLSTQAQLNVDGKTIDLGLTSIKQYGYKYTLVRMPMLDHRAITNFTGGAGFHKEIYYVPQGKIKTVGGGMVDRIRYRYMPKSKDGGMIYETDHGRQAPIPNSEVDTWRKVYSAIGGLEVFGEEHFALTALA